MPHPSAYDPDIDDHHEPPDDVTTTTVDMLKMQELMTKLRSDLLGAYAARQDKAAHDGQADVPN